MAATHDDPLDDALADALPAGERLAWTGRPQRLPAPFWGPSGGAVVVAAVFVLLLVAPSRLYLGVPVAAWAVGAGLRWRQMRGTIYGLTAAHAVVLETFPRRRETVVPLATASYLRLEPGRGDLGTIHVGATGGGPGARFEHVRRPKAALAHARRAFGGPPEAVEDAYRPPRPGLGARLRGGCAVLLLLWAMVVVLGAVFSPGLMSGGG